MKARLRLSDELIDEEPEERGYEVRPPAAS